ncbi:hypothetical protein HV011_04115 [Citrobacter freundii]|uniref:hypothetical protein n=1 Tax=Citrobacter freundii TaxID=546 RepID=UPI0015E8ED57|nr:hypothetical protein [Citrobacter freundii]QMB04821.1 hypothetical protein HV011_04115 [Citrobacter freundii]
MNNSNSFNSTFPTGKHSRVGTGYQNTFDVKSKRTAFSPSQRQRIPVLGRELRSATGKKRERLMAEFDEMLDSVNPTPADIRMITQYAKTGSSTADELSTDDAGKLQEISQYIPNE